MVQVKHIALPKYPMVWDAHTERADEEITVQYGCMPRTALQKTNYLTQSHTADIVAGNGIILKVLMSSSSQRFRH